MGVKYYPSPDQLIMCKWYQFFCCQATLSSPQICGTPVCAKCTDHYDIFFFKSSLPSIVKDIGLRGGSQFDQSQHVNVCYNERRQMLSLIRQYVWLLIHIRIACLCVDFLIQTIQCHPDSTNSASAIMLANCSILHWGFQVILALYFWSAMTLLVWFNVALKYFFKATPRSITKRTISTVKVDKAWVHTKQFYEAKSKIEFKSKKKW